VTDEQRIWEISRVLGDNRDATLDEALRMAREATDLGVPCDVAESTVWGGWTIRPRD
jgi:vancomycin permeability regulator SanA